jgi:hypothetical protein
VEPPLVHKQQPKGLSAILQPRMMAALGDQPFGTMVACGSVKHYGMGGSLPGTYYRL